MISRKQSLFHLMAGARIARTQNSGACDPGLSCTHIPRRQRTVRIFEVCFSLAVPDKAERPWIIIPTFERDQGSDRFSSNTMPYWVLVSLFTHLSQGCFVHCDPNNQKSKWICHISIFIENRSK